MKYTKREPFTDFDCFKYWTLILSAPILGAGLILFTYVIVFINYLME